MAEPFTIRIDTDKDCSRCGEKGAVGESGICLKCVGKEITGRIKTMSESITVKADFGKSITVKGESISIRTKIPAGELRASDADTFLVGTLLDVSAIIGAEDMVDAAEIAFRAEVSGYSRNTKATGIALQIARVASVLPGEIEGLCGQTALVKLTMVED